jgi:Fanconi anemia group J protein
VWNQLQRLKQIVPEPRKAGDEFDAAIAQYYKAVAEGRGGLFMAVCRGKVRSVRTPFVIFTAVPPL